MEVKMFSSTLPEYKSEIKNPDLLDSLFRLKTLTGADLRLQDWGNDCIAIALTLQVDLPSRGNFNKIDIREEEPVLLVFDLINYPSISPQVFTDRLDFPKNSLAHLYVAVKGRPPGFCYVRGNANEWYSNKRIDDLVIRIGNWLRDAATGELTEDGEQFEPLRLESYSGNIIYDYDSIVRMTENPSVNQNKKQFAIALFELPKEDKEGAFLFIKPLSHTDIENTFKEIEIESKKTKEDLTKKDFLFGFILWNSDDIVNADYEINLPKTWQEFIAFCKFYNINSSDIEKLVLTLNANVPEYLNSFPVIVGVRRPKKVIGFSSTIEFINLRFKIKPALIVNKKNDQNIEISTMAHNQPLTKEMAARISGGKYPINSSLIFGIGALGSKVVMHLARSGKTNMSLIDPDTLSAHNLVRHVLFSDDVGSSKAEALAKKINMLYPSENVKVLSGPAFKDGLLEKKETFASYGWILDFTASNAFFNKLVTLKSLDDNKVISGSITDFGNIGILLKEGTQRNPRIDDLQAYLYSQSKDEISVSDWLVREKAALNDNNLIVRVGIGCNSETTILSDDTVSSHASYFSGILRKQKEGNDAQGKIYLQTIEEAEDYTIVSKTYTVSPFSLYNAVNDSSWQIRITPGITEELKRLMVEAGDNETGGVFIGICNYKTKTIHVTELIKAPSDSKKNPSEFIRGKEGLAERIREIEEKSGGQLGYIGEWHSHPDGPNFLSSTDMKSVDFHKEELAVLKAPLPVFLSIITPDGFYPHVF